MTVSATPSRGMLFSVSSGSVSGGVSVSGCALSRAAVDRTATASFMWTAPMSGAATLEATCAAFGAESFYTTVTLRALGKVMVGEGAW